MQYRIQKISKVECEKHKSPIIQWDYLESNLLCGDCQQSNSQIKIQNIRDDIMSYYYIAQGQRQNGFQQLDNLKIQMNTFIKKFETLIDENLKSIRQSLMDLSHFSEIEQLWINDTTTAVSLEDLKKLVRIWSSVYYCEDNKTKIREEFNHTIQQINDKMLNFSRSMLNYGKEQSIIIKTNNRNPEDTQILQLAQKPNNIKIDRLQHLEQDLKQFPNYSVCHFKVLKQCRLKQFLMPPIKENVTMIFGFHNKIDTEPFTKQEINFLQDSYPKFYEINQDVVLKKDQLYTLSLQLKDKQRKNFQFFQYSINSPLNQYLEFIDDGFISQQWGTSNQLYYTKGLFSSLIIETIE